MKPLFSFFKKVHSLVRPGSHTHPTRDWFLLIGLSALLIGLSAGWNAWSYIDSTIRDSTANVVPEVTSFDTSAVDAVQSVFTTRREESERYRGTYRFIDPSK